MSEDTKDINGRIVSVGKLPATKSLQVQVALVGLCGEALFKAVSANKDDQEAVGAAALSALSANLDSDRIEKTMLTLMSVITIDGKRQNNLDSAFPSEYVQDMWPTFFFALKVNFSSFFKGSLFTSLGQKLEKLNPSNPQTSTGTSVGQ